MGPVWGIKNSDGNWAGVGLKRVVYVSFNQGYHIYNNITKWGGSWFQDGLRGSHGVAFSTGWYKFGFLAKDDNIQIEAYDVDYLDAGSPIHGTASKVIDSGFSDFAAYWGLGGWNGLYFIGDMAVQGDLVGIEDINIAIAGGNGIFAGIGDGTAPVTPKNVSSWGSVKALYR